MKVLEEKLDRIEKLNSKVFEDKIKSKGGIDVYIKPDAIQNTQPSAPIISPQKQSETENNKLESGSKSNSGIDIYIKPDAIQNTQPSNK